MPGNSRIYTFMKHLNTFTFALAIFAATECHAQGSNETVLIGVGTGSCGQYLQLRAAHSPKFNDSFEGWISGFVSGTNHARFTITRSLKLLPDGPSMLAYVDKFCRENPLKTVFNGADALFAELPEWRPPARE